MAGNHAIAPLTWRRFTHQNTNSASGATNYTGPWRGTEAESVAVAQVCDNGTELARAGRTFMGGCQVISSGIAPDTAIPTTTAKLALYNSDTPGTGVSILVSAVSFALGSGTPTAGAALFLSTSTAIVAAASVPTMAADYVAGSCSGTTTYTSKAIWGTAVTLPAATKWTSAGSNLNLAAANVGQGDTWVIPDGGILLRPGYAMGISILSGAGTSPLFVVSAFWSEHVLDVE